MKNNDIIKNNNIIKKNTKLYNEYRLTTHKIPSIKIINKIHKKKNLVRSGSRIHFMYIIRGIEFKNHYFNIEHTKEVIYFDLNVDIDNSTKVYKGAVNMAASRNDFLKHGDIYELDIKESNIDHLIFKFAKNDILNK